MQHIDSLKKEFGLLLVGGIVLAASFMWKDLLSSIGEMIFLNNIGIYGRILYTLFITFIFVILLILIKDSLITEKNITEYNQKINNPTK